MREEPTSIWAYPQAVVKVSYSHSFTQRLYAEGGVELSPVLDIAGGVAVIFFPVALHIALGWKL